MTDGTPQAPAKGKVLWHLTMSLDGFIAGPNHSMTWMSGLSFMTEIPRRSRISATDPSADRRLP